MTPSMIRAVVLLRHVADAGRQAALDVVVEARDPAVAAGLRALARPVGEDAVQDVERLAHLLRVRVRAEVDDAAPVPLAREHDARVLVLHGHRDVRERLVVAQPDVERRRWRLTRFCSRWSASTSVAVTITSMSRDALRAAAHRARPPRWPGSSCARAAAATSPCRRREGRPARPGRGRRRASPGAASAVPRRDCP